MLIENILGCASLTTREQNTKKLRVHEVYFIAVRLITLVLREIFSVQT